MKLLAAVEEQEEEMIREKKRQRIEADDVAGVAKEAEEEIEERAIDAVLGISGEDEESVGLQHPKVRKLRIRGGRVVNQKRMLKAMAELQAQGMVYVDDFWGPPSSSRCSNTSAYKGKGKGYGKYADSAF